MNEGLICFLLLGKTFSWIVLNFPLPPYILSVGHDSSLLPLFDDS